MRTFALTVCLFFAGSSVCFAYGAIATGLHPDFNRQPRATYSVNQPSKAEAERAALTACTNFKYRNCSILLSFENTCAQAAMGNPKARIYGGTDPGRFQATTNAAEACTRDGNNVCSFVLENGVICDRTPGLPLTKPAVPSASANLSNTISTTSTPTGGGISIDGISGFIFFVAAIGFGFYWLYWRWTSKEIPVSALISAEETARDRSEIKLLQEQAKLPPLPPPVLPERPPSPVTGIMRVDVTQTDKTVDVFVVLSEQSKFIVEKHDLANIPIEENLDGLQAHLKEHMMRYSDDYDLDTKIGIQDTVEYRAPVTQAIHKDVMETANRKYQAEREAEKKYKLREEQERETKYYTAAHTVLLGQYLTNPYRKIVANRLEANHYLARLEKEYLPKIKALLESAPAQGQKSYDF